ncbi:biotin transporter BioY [Bacillus sp. AGMB 02131]|uniref:Biotin transporter n=1 Tax=Peribacillus faecalis TaxID=2772559 RepID=A0A927HBI3_9BACI|nr:biotin transporter BioY [Peribacillus faecalis]MBD3109775.1 biotin transporter BioY [Peribacillus faecalis]
MKKTNLHYYIITALFTAFITIFSQVTIPLPPVPITGQTLAIGIAATILGRKYGTLSVLLYLIIGAVGVPVFAGMSGGISKLVGPTGGYLVGFLPTAYIIGLFVEKTKLCFTNAFIANIIGMVITLAFGTAWLKIAASLSWSAAIAGGVTPFLLVGILKAAIAAYISVLVRKRLLNTRYFLA